MGIILEFEQLNKNWACGSMEVRINKGKNILIFFYPCFFFK